jgi:putative component of toxin-antitoxin plasmid stabilization module
MIEVREYLDPKNRSPYATWFAHLDPKAAAKVATALIRLAAGNFSSVKGVVILLGGGTKKRQQRDISVALANWQDYKRRKKEEQDATDS